MVCPRRCIVTLVAFVWLFSIVRFQMSPQMACLRRDIVTLAAFVRLVIVGVFQPRGRKGSSTPEVGDWSEDPRFCGPPVRLRQGYPKCIDLATCFGLSRTVIKHQLNDKTWKSTELLSQNLQKSKSEKWKWIFLASNLLRPFLLELAPILALHPVQLEGH